MKRCYIFLALALVALAAVAMEVESKHDPEADFAAYESYAWKPRPEVPPEDIQADGSPLDREIRTIADHQLQAKGLRRSSNGEPDLWITWYGSVSDELDLSGVKYQITPWLEWEMEPVTRAYKQGTLVLDVIDAETNTLIWSGWATDVARTPQELVDKVEKAVRRILKRFPPKD